MQKANTFQAVTHAYRFTLMGSYQLMFIEGGMKSVNINKWSVYSVVQTIWSYCITHLMQSYMIYSA